jgi:hypothetical protein
MHKKRKRRAPDAQIFVLFSRGAQTAIDPVVGNSEAGWLQLRYCRMQQTL